MVGWVVEALREAGVDRTVVVVGHGAQAVKDTLGESLEFAEQTERLGTAHATSMAMPLLDGFQGPLLVLAGDTPLLKGETLKTLVSTLHETGAKAVLATCRVADPTGYGRIVRNESGDIVAIVEHKDCTPSQRLIDEINPAVYCFDAETLRNLLPEVKNDNAQGEYYLPDVIRLIVEKGEAIVGVERSDPDEFYGVNDRWQLAEASQILKTRILRHHAEAGVSIIDPMTTMIGPDVELGQDVVVHPNTVLSGTTKIGAGAQVGPNSWIRDAVVGEQCTVFLSHVHQARIEKRCKIGPFANIRPGSVVGAGSKVGNFVELKNAELESEVSVSHLTYLGDARIGSGTNIGAGTITCNYDGFAKHRTEIGAGCFIGSNSTLVAPVQIADDSFVAAGSVITEDVPSGAMAIGRSRQTVKDGWFAQWRKQKTNP